MRLGSISTTSTTSTASAGDALVSGFGDLGLGLSSSVDDSLNGHRDGIVSQPSTQQQPQERLTPRVQQLTLEIAKLQQQIKQLTRRRKKLDALNPKPHAGREGFMERKAAEYFAIDERRRRMQSALPPTRVAKTKRTRARVDRTRGQAKRANSLSQCRASERCGVEAAPTSEPREPDERLSLSFLLS